MIDLMVVGGGRMGEALVRGLLASMRPELARPAELARGEDSMTGGSHGAGASSVAGFGEIAVVETDPARRAALAELFPSVQVVDSPRASDGAVIAVKPQHASASAESLGRAGVNRVLSIAAGVRTATIEAALPAGTPVVRAMPNTPALLGEGAAAIAGGSAASDDDISWAESILGSIGTVVRVDEMMLDAVTGLSGSGPAYVFLLAEAMIQAGIDQGLDPMVSDALVRQTLLGAARLLTESGQLPAELRAAVTSPGGTTEAGVGVLEAGGMRDLLSAAITAATERSRELGSS